MYDKEHIEVDVQSILEKDGIKTNDLLNSNQEIVNLMEILASNDTTSSWSKRVIDTDSNSMTIIAQMPGEGNRRHYHPDWNEWWYIIQGEWEWEIEDKKKQIKAGDIIMVEKRRVHKITAIGDKMAIRMAVSRADVEHVYV